MLTFNSVSFGYGQKGRAPLFQGLSLDMPAGACYGLLGLNGAGKTSLLKLASGGLFPAEGHITLDGREPGQRSHAVLEDVVYVPEDPWVPALTVDAWLASYAPFRPRFDRDRFNQLLADFELAKNQNLAKVSYGQRKKFAVAAALASGARVILLDEPTNGLDIPAKGQLRQALASQTTDSSLLVVSTHQVRDLEALMDPILVLHNGRIVSTISQEDLTQLTTIRVKDLAGIEAIYAQEDAMGWTVLTQADGNTAAAPVDLELVFAAAIHQSEKLNAALAGRGK